MTKARNHPLHSMPRDKLVLGAALLPIVFFYKIPHPPSGLYTSNPYTFRLRFLPPVSIVFISTLLLQLLLRLPACFVNHEGTGSPGVMLRDVTKDKGLECVKCSW